MRSFFLTLFSLVCFTGMAQVDDFQRDIMDYLDAKGTKVEYIAYYDDMFEALKKNFEHSKVPQSVWNELSKDKAERIDDVMGLLSFAYRKHFTQGEIIEMKNFYLSKAAQKLIKQKSASLSKRENNEVNLYFESDLAQKEAAAIPIMSEDISQIFGHWRRDLFGAKMKALLIQGYVPEQ